VIARDRGAQFRFGSLQSMAAGRLLQEVALPNSATDSFVVLEGDRVSTRSTAALRVVRRLPFPWWLAYALIVVPRPIRDRLYDWVARNRYRWFGRRDVCMVPTPELRSRFIGD